MAVDLKGQVAAITGASSGIGAATARELASRGCRLVLGARRVERLEELRKALPGDADVRIAPLDVTDPASCESFASFAGPVDLLVNNAGLAKGNDKLVDAREEDWRSMIETNVVGVLRMTRLLLPAMIARGSGSVIFVGSVAGLEPYPGGTVYCATKAGVRSIAKALRHELLGKGVRVSTVEPGAVETEFSLVRFGGDEARAKAVYRGSEPLVAEDVAEAIGFLASRPPHVDVEELVLYPTAQAGTMAFYKR
jgi:NADP-dependent 3-hydroxy acid dehydrogenase YdfG